MIEKNLPILNNKSNISIQFRSRSESRLSNRFLTRNNQVIQQNVRQKLGDQRIYEQNQISATNLINQIIEQNPSLSLTIKKLESSYNHYKIASFYQSYFLSHLLLTTKQKIQDNLNQQINKIKRNQTHYQQIITTIKARQGCLRFLQKILANTLPSTNPLNQDWFRNFRQEIINYRKLTLMVVKQIKLWKDSLLYLANMNETQQYIAFYHHNQDYFSRILNDNMFIFNSFLSTQVTFSQKNDPFILKPSFDKLTKYSQLFSVQLQQKQQYIIILNYLAQQRGKQLKKRISLKQNKLKKIQRLYQSTNKGLQSQYNLQRYNSIKSPIKDNLIIKDKLIIRNRKGLEFVGNFGVQNNPDPNDYQHKMNRIKHIKELVSVDSLYRKSKNHHQLGDKQDVFNLKGKQLLQSPIKLKYSDTYDEDFTKMMRNKQLLILEEVKKQKNKQSTSVFASRLRSNINVNKNSPSKQSQSQLKQIISNLQKSHPFANKPVISLSRQSPQEHMPIIPLTKSIIQKNEQTIHKLRESILNQIKEQKIDKEKIEASKYIEQQRVQNVLRNQMETYIIDHVHGQRQKRLYGKQQLAKSINTQAAFGFVQKDQVLLNKSSKLTQLQQQLKKQFQLKWLRQVHSQLKRKTNLNNIDLQKQLQQQKLAKQINKLNQKQQRQRRYQEIQKEQRAKNMKITIQLDQERKKQIQKEMEQVIIEEREKLKRFTVRTRQEVQLELKQQIKVNILQQLQQQKSLYFQQQKLTQQQLRFKEAQYRKQVKKNLQKQYQIEDIVKRQQLRDEKSKKLKLLQQKFGSFDQKLNENLQKGSNLIKSHLKIADYSNQQAKSILLGSFNQKMTDRQQNPHKYKLLQQQQRKKMRQQFEIQLFACTKPQKYSSIGQEFGLKIKQPMSYDETRVQNRQQQLKKQIQKMKIQTQQKSIPKQSNIIQKEFQPQIEFKAYTLESSSQNNAFQKFSQSLQNSRQQINNNFQQTSKINLIQNIQTLVQDQKNRMKLGMTVEQYGIYKIKKDKINLKRVQIIKDDKKDSKFKLRNTQKQQKKFQIQDQSYQQIKFTQNLAGSDQIISNFQYNPSANNIGNDQPENTNQKSNISHIQNNQAMRLTIHSNFRNDINQRQDRFMTSQQSQQSSSQISQESSQQQERKVQKIRKTSKRKVQKKIQQLDLSSQTKRHQKISKQHKQHKSDKIIVSIVKVAEQQLEVVLKQHFSVMPRVLKRLNLTKRDQLILTLKSLKSFSILKCTQSDHCIGLMIVSHNQQKTSLRSVNILHLGAYLSQNMIKLMMCGSEFVFRIERCQEITWSLFYDQIDDQQRGVVKIIQQSFDQHGVIFQKKINQSQIERKHILRRKAWDNKNIPQQHSLGQIVFQSDLFASDKPVAKSQQFLNSNQQQVGIYGLVSLYLAQNIGQQELKSLIVCQDKYIKAQTKHLCKQSVSLKQDIKKVSCFKTLKFPTIFQLNLQLHNQNKPILKCLPSTLQQPINQVWSNSKLNIQLSFTFIDQQTRFNFQDDQYKAKYMRFKIDGQKKAFALKSKLYNTQAVVLPCSNSKYKLMVLSAQQLDSLNKTVPIDVYIKLLLSNVQSVQSATKYQHIWLPHFKSLKKCKFQDSKLFQKDIKVNSALSFTYTSYLQNSYVLEPTHRDLFITLPFIMGILDSKMQLLSEGSTLFAQRINIEDLVGVKLMQKIIDQD